LATAFVFRLFFITLVEFKKKSAVETADETIACYMNVKFKYFRSGTNVDYDQNDYLITIRRKYGFKTVREMLKALTGKGFRRFWLQLPKLMSVV
jgi:hypothetical protein